MALHHAASGELVDVQPLGDGLRHAFSSTLVRSDQLEVFRLVMAAGDRVPDHKLPRNFQLRGQSTVHCLEGAVELQVNDQFHLLRGGSLIYLDAGETCALKAVEDSAVLVTLVREPAAREAEGPAAAAGHAAAPLSGR